MRTDPTPALFLRLVEPALRQAAAIARALEGRVANRPKHGERSAAKAALTLADTATQEALLVPLSTAFAEVALEAEEDTPTVACFSGRRADHRIVIDPIDGTLRHYLGAEGPYAVLAGLAVGGRYEASAVALPREGLLFSAQRGSGACRAVDGGTLQSVRVPAGGGRGVLVSDTVPEAVRERLVERGYRVQVASGGAIAVAPLVPGFCAGLRIAPARGSVSTRGRIGLLVAREAGALVEQASGAPFPEDIDAPARDLLVASDPDARDAVRRALLAGG